MISPAAKKKLPWKTYGAIFAVWATLMAPVAWLTWGSGPKGISDLQNLQDEPGVSPGLAKDWYLDAGAHGIWVTLPIGDTTFIPLEALRVIGPTGLSSKLVFPPGESITLTENEEKTSIVAAFRVVQPGNYSLYLDPDYVKVGNAKFGPAWETGQIIDSSQGIFSLAIGWVVTMGCAIFAFRKTVRSDPDLVE